MARWAEAYDKIGNYFGILDARTLTQKDKELYDFRCIGCGVPVFLVCRKKSEHNRFVAKNHNNENGKCDEDKSLKAIIHYRDVEFHFEKMMQYKKRSSGGTKGPGPGPGGEPGTGTTEIGPFIDLYKPLSVNNAKTMYQELSTCNLTETRGGYIVGDIYVPNVEQYLKLKEKGAFSGFKMVLLVRCKPLKEVPNGYTCFILRNDDEFSAKKVYFLIKLYDEFNVEFKRDSISTDVAERKEYTSIAVLGNWEKFKAFDNVYICNSCLDLDCVHFVK